MKTRTWIILICVILLVCLGLSLWLMLPGQKATHVEIYSQGKLLYQLDLSQDRVFTVTTEEGENEITIRDGAIAVTRADCPDGYCMDRGFCAGGLQIVCLPHQLVIRFVTPQAVDGVTG